MDGLHASATIIGHSFHTGDMSSRKALVGSALEQGEHIVGGMRDNAFFRSHAPSLYIRIGQREGKESLEQQSSARRRRAAELPRHRARHARHERCHRCGGKAMLFGSASARQFAGCRASACATSRQVARMMMMRSMYGPSSQFRQGIDVDVITTMQYSLADRAVSLSMQEIKRLKQSMSYARATSNGYDLKSLVVAKNQRQRAPKIIINAVAIATLESPARLSLHGTPREDGELHDAGHNAGIIRYAAADTPRYFRQLTLLRPMDASCRGERTVPRASCPPAHSNGALKATLQYVDASKPRTTHHILLRDGSTPRVADERKSEVCHHVFHAAATYKHFS